jgi:hypothetical protein
MLGIFFLPNFVAGQEAAGSVTVEVIGIGKDAESALRNALYQAVEQAVGAYVDNETVIDNEEVIHEKLLSVAQGFVERYEVIQPSRERRDGSGVWETRVSASVKKSKVGAALRAAGVMQVAADGTAAWAEQITRLKSREDAMELLEKLSPEIPRNLFVCRLAEKEGELRTAEDPQSGDLLALVDIEVSVNSEWWDHEALPALNAAFNVLKLRDFEPKVSRFTLKPFRELRSQSLKQLSGTFSTYQADESTTSFDIKRENGTQNALRVSLVRNFSFPYSEHTILRKDSREGPHEKMTNFLLAGLENNSRGFVKQFKLPDDYASRIYSSSLFPSNDEFYNLCFVNFLNGENRIVHHGKFLGPCWGRDRRGEGIKSLNPWLISPFRVSIYEEQVCTTRMVCSVYFKLPSEALREVKHIRLEPARYGVKR